ncbi:MAG: tRNA (guanosine(37)-N1)-methyltransferase TrmD [Sandaracinaceae bacterium]|nr:tRNA (guanosine(37)-N1)-methyltransferase TrmD [Sandaracinaceae bacterium]
MHFYIITVLPEIFDSFLQAGLLGKAIARGLVAVERVNPRDFTSDRHRTVDDTPYGGGNGMVMKAPPIVEAMEAAEARELARSGKRPFRILLSAQGVRFDQGLARKLAKEQKAITLICGRYEGIDERAVRRADLELSIGDYVLMGGEVAAMAVIESVARLIPWVIGNPESLEEESFASGLLEGPHYTRPAVFRGEEVPEVLRSGHHEKVAKWRRREALRKTLRMRPDLLASAPLKPEDLAVLEQLRAELEVECQNTKGESEGGRD